MRVKCEFTVDIKQGGKKKNKRGDDGGEGGNRR